MPNNAPAQNTLLARLECSFKGETLTLERVIDLDGCLAQGEDAPNFHATLARAGGIDPYSYLYEVLESEAIAFSEPTGLAVGCCVDGQFDWNTFVHTVRETQALKAIQTIALREMDVTDLDTQNKLKSALLAAYREGLHARKAASG